jgi:RNA polymerase sigma-70 factor (ECF subfamily)
MDLLQRFARGDLDAFETLFRTHQHEVYRWTLMLVRNPAEAEDLTLEAFWRIYRAHARFDARREFGPWARRIAVNCALASWKKRRRETALRPEEWDALPARPASDGAQSREQRRAVLRALTSLRPKLRAVAVLALIEERPYAEIASALGLSEEAVKSRVFRAVKALRASLREMGMEP